MTGTSAKKGEGCGKLVVFDRQTLARLAELDVAPQSVCEMFLFLFISAYLKLERLIQILQNKAGSVHCQVKFGVCVGNDNAACLVKVYFT